MATNQYADRKVEELVRVYAEVAAQSTVQAQYDARLQHLEGLVKDRSRLLDFGCAAGYFVEMAQARGWDAHGVELGKWAAEAAALRSVRNIHIGPLEALDFEPGSFDVVHAAQVLEHLPRPRVQLEQLARLVRPNGVVYVDVPNYRTLSILLNRDDFVFNEPPQHLNYFTPHTLRRLLQSQGLLDVRLTTSGGLKWENLLGRPATSEIKAAYERAGSGSSAPAERRHRRRPLGLGSAKTAVRAALVRPILYQGLKLGMALAATARRP